MRCVLQSCSFSYSMVQVLGTLITEWDEGRAKCEAILHTPSIPAAYLVDGAALLEKNRGRAHWPSCIALTLQQQPQAEEVAISQLSHWCAGRCGKPCAACAAGARSSGTMQ